MCEFKGTKGKWFFDKENAKVRKEDGNVLCICYHTNIINKEESEPNALLISKAPEMLKMLEELKGIFDKYSVDFESEFFKYKQPLEQLIKEATQI